MIPRIIQDIADELYLLFLSYQKAPTSARLKRMFKLTLDLGVEIGKEKAYHNFRLSKGDQEVTPCIKRESRDTPVALKLLLEIYKQGELVFEDKKEASKAVANLRKFCEYNKMPYKFSKSENKVKIV